MTAVALLFLIAAWAIVSGIFEIAAAIRLRKEIKNEWLLILSGGLSVAFGILMIANPGAGAMAVLWLIGVFVGGLRRAARLPRVQAEEARRSERRGSRLKRGRAPDRRTRLLFRRDRSAADSALRLVPVPIAESADVRVRHRYRMPGDENGEEVPVARIRRTCASTRWPLRASRAASRWPRRLAEPAQRQEEGDVLGDTGDILVVAAHRLEVVAPAEDDAGVEAGDETMRRKSTKVTARPADQRSKRPPVAPPTTRPVAIAASMSANVRG